MQSIDGAYPSDAFTGSTLRVGSYPCIHIIYLGVSVNRSSLVYVSIRCQLKLLLEPTRAVALIW
jgi:hypothetical protein